MYSINILIFCYNQEDCISRAIDSILIQRNHGLNKIIIQDDCSKDSTWNIILKYQQKYSQIIVPYRNSHNLGIYGNYEQMIKNRGKADLYGIIAGDDSLDINWFYRVQSFLKKNKIELKGVAASILSDFKIIKSTGVSYINRNNKYVDFNKDLVSLKIRGIISARSMLSTSLTYDRFEPLIIDEGLGLAEGMADIRPFMHSDICYYVPGIGSYYYAGIGVSTKLGGEKYYKERIKYYERAKELFPLNLKAEAWMNFLIMRRKYELNPTLKNYYRLFLPYIKSCDRYTLHCKSTHIKMFIRLFSKLFRNKETQLREM